VSAGTPATTLPPAASITPTLNGTTVVDQGWIYGGVAVGSACCVLALTAMGAALYRRRKRALDSDPLAASMRNYETFVGPIGPLHPSSSPPESESNSPDNFRSAHKSLVALDVHYAMITSPLSPEMSVNSSAESSRNYDRVPPQQIIYDSAIHQIHYDSVIRPADSAIQQIIYDAAVPLPTAGSRDRPMRNANM
jgi:hypothetical protein